MIGKLVNIAEKINRGAPDRRKENLQVWTRHQLWIHASGLLKKRAAQAALAGPEPVSDARQIPHWINRYLDDGDAAILVDNPAVGGQTPGGDGGLIGDDEDVSNASVGLMSSPSAISPRKFSATRWPQGSSPTIRMGSLHCGNGPMVAAGWVLVRSGRRIGSSAPEDTASARYTAYDPPWLPITLRSCGRDTVPMIGPRSRAVAAPQKMGKFCLAPGTGCDVRRM